MKPQKSRDSKLDVKTMKEIFCKVQSNKQSYKQNSQTLRKILNEVDLETFCEEFFQFLSVPISKGQHTKNVNNVLEWAAEFIVTSSLSTSQPDDSQDEGEIGPLLAETFSWMLKNHSAKSSSARYGICRFMNIIFDTMARYNEARLSDEWIDEILEKMFERVVDKAAKVRAQAAKILTRIADQKDKNCPVIKTLIYHLDNDPSHEVRKTITTNIPKNNITVRGVIKKVIDIHEDVRKAALEFLVKIPVRSLTIEHRDFILQRGLKDSSEKVRNCIQNTLLPSWLENYDKDYLKLLQGLDAENAADTAISCLEMLFRTDKFENLENELKLDKITRVIEVEKLTSEKVLFWFCLLKNVKENGSQEYFEELVPELSVFCEYIKNFVHSMSATIHDNENSWDEIKQEFILHRLLEITKLFDLSDESGRSKLRELMLEILQLPFVSSEIIKSIVAQLENVVPDVDTRLSILTKVIDDLKTPMIIEKPNQEIEKTQVSDSEYEEIRKKKTEIASRIRAFTEAIDKAVQAKSFLEANNLKEEITKLGDELKNLSKEPETGTDCDIATKQNKEVVEENNDPQTLKKCLTIISEMLRGDSVKNLNSSVRTIVENVVIVNINNENLEVRILALTTLGICCLLDSTFVKQYLHVFLLEFAKDDENVDVLMISIKTMIDSLVCWGLAHLDDKKESKQENHPDESQNLQKGNTIVKFLIRLVDSEDQELRTIAAEGLTKLLLTQRISSHQIVSRLLILFFNPMTEDDGYLNFCLGNFVNFFPANVPGSQQQLQQAFLPTIQTIENAPKKSPLREIDSLKLAQTIIRLTCSDVPKNKFETNTVHNDLVFEMLNEIANANSKIPPDVLVKSLKFLHIQIDSDRMKNDLKIAIQRAWETLQETKQKTLSKLVANFEVSLGHHTEEQEDESVAEKDQSEEIDFDD